MIPIKNKGEIEKIRKASRITSELLFLLGKEICPGITTLELDRIAFNFIKRKGAEPAFKGYRSYPATLCTSVNGEVVHGIPSSIELKEGDIVGIDAGVGFDHYYGDSTRTFSVGKISSEASRLLKTTREALNLGIKKAVVGNRVSDISYAIGSHVEKKGYSVVREFVGHGIGRELHEEPEIPNFGSPGQGSFLRSGMVFAIEPMVNMGKKEIKILKNGWTAVTSDGKPSAHFEDTVLIGEDGPEVLT
ncbi:MAG: type I methionyl aminopeptidase [Candidatus Omnitrophica bacterium]|nr:type I methionyl aminopeptidase [Candidatus Omnitrophota bacterium]